MAFYLKTENFPKSSFMQRSTYPKDWMHFPRIPNEYIIFIINEGTLYISENDYKYELHTGDMLVLEPGLFHTGYQGAYVDYYFIHMPPDTFCKIELGTEEILKEYFIKNKHNYYVANPSGYELYDSFKPLLPKEMRIETSAFLHIKSKVDEVMNALSSGDEYYKLLCSRNILDILICLSKCYTDIVSNTNLKPEISTKRDIRIEDILFILQNEYQSKLTGKDIENHLHMNFDYLNRIFKAEIGLTIFEYLKIFRINKAKKYLTNSNMKIYEIAKLTGFSNEYHFNRVFSSKVGTSPGKYRLNN